MFHEFSYQSFARCFHLLITQSVNKNLGFPDINCEIGFCSEAAYFFRMYQAFGYKNAINGNKNKKRKQKRENTFRTTSEGLNPLIQQQVTDPQSTLSLGNLDMEPNTRVLLNNGLGQDSFESFREHFEPSSGLTNEAIAVTLNSRSPLYGNEEKVSLGNSNDHIDSSQAVSKENEDVRRHPTLILYHLCIC